MVKSGILPPTVKDTVIYRLKSAEKTSRLIRPLSKDETAYRSSAFDPTEPILAVTGTAPSSHQSF